MSFGAIDHLLLRLRFHPSSANPCPSRRLHSLPFFNHRPPIRSRRPVFGRIHSTSPLPRKSLNNPFVSELLVLLAFSALLLCLRVFSNIILPDFTGRWRELAAFAAEAEVRTSSYPWHVWQAIVAYEDQRFFRHLGIDPVGTARAVMSFSALGGGSTITQQLVKNTFLKNERTLPRKIVEMVLALALERTMSKRRILSCYVNKIYWGHGIYDIKSASIFYFGKHPSLLSLGESAMLAGIIPAPELRSPLKDLSRGKTFQVRVLRRMVEVGSLDIETALLVMKQSIQLRVEMSKFADMLLHPLAFSNEKLDASNKLEQVTPTTLKDIWDWEKESRAREACEDMERWAIKVRLIDHGTSAKHSGCSEKRMFPR